MNRPGRYHAPVMSKPAASSALPVNETRMSFGEHIEELRRRLIYALYGLAAALVLCFAFGPRIISVMLTPYYAAMRDLGFNPRMAQINPTELITKYFDICLKMGLVVAAPWILYQLWLFVAAGLYPSEQRLVRRVAPTSIALFLVGAGFMVTVVLTGLVKFLISIGGSWFPLPDADSPFVRLLMDAPQVATTSAPAAPPLNLPVVDADPAAPSPGAAWINRERLELNVHFDGKTYVAALEPSETRRMVHPLISVAEYLDFVVNLALAFGLGFQIPIVVVFLIAVGLVPARVLGGARKYVALAIAILSAIVTPTPDVGTMVLLAGPMYLLFEAGLLIGMGIERRRRRDESMESPGAGGAPGKA